MKKFSARRKSIAGVAAMMMLAFPLAACGSDDDGGSSSSAPTPVAELTALTGDTTAVTLDQGFVDALGSLGVTPGVVGTGELKDGALIFPITGGNVTIFTPGEVSPYVIGQVQHEGSGFSLSAGGTKVDIGNFNVDPGASIVYGDVNVNAKPAAVSVPIFDLNGNTLNPLDTSSESGKAILEGTEVKLSATAAGLLRDTFGTEDIPDKLLIGVAKITVALP